MILCLLEKRYKSVPGNFHNTDEKGKKRARGGGGRKRKENTKRHKAQTVGPVAIFSHILASIPQLILQEISPEYSLEGLTLKLKLQYFGHLM